MKENLKEIKTFIYVGMSIFNEIKDVELMIDSNILSLKDKKYLSLYLGIINTKNKVSDYLKEKEVKFKFPKGIKYLSQEEYLYIYDMYFVDILKEISFNSVEENLNNLLSKKIIQDFNMCNGYYATKTINERNKQLIKTIN